MGFCRYLCSRQMKSLNPPPGISRTVAVVLVATGIVAGAGLVALLNGEHGRPAGQLKSPDGGTPIPSTIIPTSRDAAATIQSNDELFALDPQILTELSITAPNWRIIAFRWTAADNFTVISASREKPLIKTCAAAPSFGRVLVSLSTLRARRPLPREEGIRVRKSLKQRPIRFLLDDSSDVGPTEWEFAVTSGSHPAVIAYSADVPAGVEVAIDSGIFEFLSHGCESLGLASKKEASHR
jgi:hypothetical protein